VSAPCDRFERDHLAELLAPGALDGDARAHLDRCVDCGARVAGYQRIARAMRDIGASHVRRPDHLARLWAQLDAPPMRRPGRWLRFAAPAVALAAAAALIFWLRGGEPPPRFAVEVISHGAIAIRGDAGLGDRLRVRARAGAAVWIYRNDRELLLACPRDCERDSDALTGEVTLDAIGRYQIVWVSAASAPAPAPGGELERDVAAASAAGASHELREIVVE
jgi:hypothetical protein